MYLQFQLTILILHFIVKRFVLYSRDLVFVNGSDYFLLNILEEKIFFEKVDIS